ncbi:MAG: hypothetical protein P8184_13655 [Calditrichia bacterium]
MMYDLPDGPAAPGGKHIQISLQQARKGLFEQSRSVPETGQDSVPVFWRFHAASVIILNPVVDA